FIGHTLGASEGIEAVYSVLSIRDGRLFPNLNFHTPLEETGLQPVTEAEAAQRVEINHLLSNSFGFGGSNSSLVFSKIKQS
ncbi:beta-ketoacyl-[acyl-carrier-protein] synthase family protein, partial [Bacteroides sp. OttesenSCG-928-F21]|nr:beta-ketoacyl-[acyl-carrier-protein] synthase family protein [Bacteroides sp. OttesenSCG-928-F21]